jgi:uncharacterized protein
MLTRVLTMPETIVRLSRQVTSTALTNARRSTAGLVRSNAERLALHPVSSADQARPGELQRLSRDECLRLLSSRRIGRFAHVESARALDVVPVNYVSRPDGSVLLLTGPGPKLSAADRRDIVALQVDDIDEDSRTGWSVLVVGRARRLTPREVVEAAADLPHPWATGPRHQAVVIEPTRIEGRQLS